MFALIFFMGNTAKCLWKTLPNKFRGKSTTPTTSKRELYVTLVTTVNYWHKKIYYKYCMAPTYASETSYYKKFENEQLQDNVESNKVLIQLEFTLYCKLIFLAFNSFLEFLVFTIYWVNNPPLFYANKKVFCTFLLTHLHANGLFLYPLKILEKQRFPVWNWLRKQRY